MADFFAKVDVGNSPAGCWLWTGTMTEDGYGKFMLNGRRRGAHRWTYEWFVGPIPDGLQIDHLCRERACVNPLHLEAVTPAENTDRGITGLVNGGRQRAKTHCPNGHEYDRTNARGYRRCDICTRASMARSNARRRGKRVPTFAEAIALTTNKED